MNAKTAASAKLRPGPVTAFGTCDTMSDAGRCGGVRTLKLPNGKQVCAACARAGKRARVWWLFHATRPTGAGKMRWARPYQSAVYHVFPQGRDMMASLCGRWLMRPLNRDRFDPAEAVDPTIECPECARRGRAWSR